LGTAIDEDQSDLAIIIYSAVNSRRRHHPMPHQQYQTVKEVADRLKVSEATVLSWFKTGALRAIGIGIGIGKCWRIADQDLNRFLVSHQTSQRANVPVENHPASGSGKRCRQ
jgi:excisionase family DNA binding protein